MPPVVATISFQIMGKGSVTLGGAGAAAGTIAGPYWNTIQITDPSLNYVSFTPLLGQPWEFVMWGGGIADDGTLAIATDVSAGYLAVAVFAEPPRGSPAPACPCPSVVLAAPPEPIHESLRIANRVRACTQTPPSAPSPAREVTTTRTVCGPAFGPPQRWVRQTAAQNTFLPTPSQTLQVAIVADASDNQYVAARGGTSSPGSSVPLILYSLDSSGNLRWKWDVTLPEADFTYQQEDPTIAIVLDPVNLFYYVAVNTVDPAWGGLVTQLYKASSVTGAILYGFAYTEPGVYGSTPPLALTTDGTSTLYLASSNTTTVFVRSMTMDGTFATIEYWAGLTNTAAAPLVARCYGLHHDPSGALYLNLASYETIQGGTRILSPFTLPNTIVVKLTDTAITRTWAYQTPALNTTGWSNTSALLVMRDHSTRLLYGQRDLPTNTGRIGWAHFSPAGTLVAQHNLPEYDGTRPLTAAALCRTPAGDRMFYLAWQSEEPLNISFGELTFGGDVTWIVRSTDYNPSMTFTMALTGATATDSFFWIAFVASAAVQDQTQTNATDNVVAEFALRECLTITETECICSPIPQAQDFRTVHHQTESNRIGAKLAQCPVHFQNRDTGGLCSSQYAAVYSPNPTPYSAVAQRRLSSVASTRNIARLVRNVSASELTARIRSRTETSNAALQRHSEHRRVFPPPRPCRLYQSGPQPGVPIAPVTQCILGNQRVDYSPPTK